jgi:lysozyme family protein
MCADFNTAYGITAENEGGYTLDPHETFRGVDRVEQPEWHGWAIIDSMKDDADFPHCLSTNPDLLQLVKNFFWANFWNAVHGDEINDQAVANKIYDAGVNMGTGEAIRLIQTAVGVTVDGIIGPNTIAAINAVPEANELAKFKNVREEHYEAIVGAHPEDQRFLAGWLSRC